MPPYVASSGPVRFIKRPPSRKDHHFHSEPDCSLAEADATFAEFLHNRRVAERENDFHRGHDHHHDLRESVELVASAPISRPKTIRDVPVHRDRVSGNFSSSTSEVITLPGMIQNLVEDNRVLEENVQCYEEALKQVCAEVSKLKRQNSELIDDAKQLSLLRKLANTTKVENEKLRAENEKLRVKYDDMVFVMVDAVRDDEKESEDLEVTCNLLHYENYKLRQLLGLQQRALLPENDGPPASTPSTSES